MYSPSFAEKMEQTVSKAIKEKLPVFTKKMKELLGNIESAINK